jgi:hypothetical protein
MMRANVALLLSILAMGGCTSAPIRRDVSRVLLSKDQQAAKRFVIELKNDSDEAWCIDDGTWPTQAGMMQFAGDQVWVDIDGRRFPAVDENRGYCVGECKIRIAPGSILTGQIPYSKFTFGQSEFGKQKKLTMAIEAELCK